MVIITSEVSFPGGRKEKSTRGFLARPEAQGRCPTLVVIHEVWGFVDHIEDVTMRFAKEGYVALAPDLFDGKTASVLEEGARLRAEFTEDKIVKDLLGAVDYLKKQEFVNSTRVACVGFCMGGWLSLLLACRSKDVAACVVYYGRNPSPLDTVKEISCPILGNYAGADAAITEKDIDMLREALTKYGKSLDIKVYPGAPHGFFNDTKQSYRADAAKDSWKRTLDFFERHLKRS